MGASAAEREMELAEAASSSFDVDGLVAHLSAAVRGFTGAGDKRRAAMASARLGDAFANYLGNQTAARAWFTRAERMISDEPPCIEQGWVAVAAIGCDVDDPTVLLARAELALDRARRFGDVNLETKALADGGLAHVQAGRVAEGMSMLDEAMALVCGPADDSAAAGKSVCSFFTACYYAADYQRAGTWEGLLRRHGVIGNEPFGPIMLSDHCDSVQAACLCELGRWGEADELLVSAIARFEGTTGFPSWHSTIALADLRIRQGRFADAEMLLLGKDGHIQALLPQARLSLARGDHGLAAALARRGLRMVADDQIRAVELLAVLVNASLAAGDLGAATEALGKLEQRAVNSEVPGLLARICAARSDVVAATADFDGAVDAVESALDVVDTTSTPWRRATLLIKLASARERAGDQVGAEIEARAAATALSALDVAVSPDDEELLTRLGAVWRTSKSRQAVLARAGRWWSVSSDGTSVRLADTKGMRYLAELLARPGVEQHALDLVDRVEGVDPMVDRRSLGDAGEVLDRAARSAYRHRIEDLRGDIDDALEDGRLERAEKLQDELDALVGHLASAFGIGGRQRRTSSAAERARLNVTRALRSATAKVAEALPGAGDRLDRQLRTGLYCAYEPTPDVVQWIVQS